MWILLLPLGTRSLISVNTMVRGGRSLCSEALAGNDQFNAAVLLPAMVVALDAIGSVIAKAAGCDRIRLHSLAHQVVPHGLCPLRRGSQKALRPRITIEKDKLTPPPPA